MLNGDVEVVLHSWSKRTFVALVEALQVVLVAIDEDLAHHEEHVKDTVDECHDAPGSERRVLIGARLQR
jgi:hypothetical protein